MVFSVFSTELQREGRWYLSGRRSACASPSFPCELPPDSLPLLLPLLLLLLLSQLLLSLS